MTARLCSLTAASTRAACKIVLSDGSEYPGCRFGARADRVCEIVFNTSMAGYQEIVSDPS